MKVGVITFTDGRKRVADMLQDQCFEFQNALGNWLKNNGHQFVGGNSIAWNYRTAIDNATRMNENHCEAVIFNFCVWAYPDFAAQAARDVIAPVCFLGNVNPAFPGWVAFFAAAGALDEFGKPFARVLGNLNENAGNDLENWLNSVNPKRREAGEIAADKLSGLRYGEFDGPSMGMYTGHIDPSQWMEQFGIHVFHRSQLTLAWLSDSVNSDRVSNGIEWLKQNCKEIKWHPERLTDEHLSKQCRFYLACKDYCKLEGIDFLGLTGQLDYTEWKSGTTMDLPEALLNDTADWEEENKKPVICATECDSNGALTMQMLHHLSNTPVLFADLRHYFSPQDIINAGGQSTVGIYDLVNSGQHAPWFSHRSDDFKKNWSEVTLHPSNEMYFPCGGASVEFFAEPSSQVTFARLTRKSGQYRMHYFTGRFVRFGDEIDKILSSQTSPEWPHCFAEFDCSQKVLANHYSSNHIHAIFGDYTSEIESMCQSLGITPILLQD